jgi:uncharacterized RDD family membrane protein YckC
VSPERSRIGPSEADFFEALGHEVRRNILRFLYDQVELSYTDLLNLLQIRDGSLNFHLRKMGPLLKHTERGTYILSEYGRLAYRFMSEFDAQTGEAGLAQLYPRPKLTASLLAKRVAAFLIDALTFFVFTGMAFDPVLWSLVSESVSHLAATMQLHPWLFHPEHLPMFGEVVYRMIGIYSHILFAVFIFFTLLEAFKGQTLGKYLLDIRVVKTTGGKVGLLEAGIRNLGKVFLLPLDLLLGLLLYRQTGFIRFFDYYTQVTVEEVHLP